MAKLSAGFVWAAVVSFLVLGHGVSGQSCVPRGRTRTVKISCKDNPDLYVTARDTEQDVVLAPDTGDSSQVWFQDFSALGNVVTDDENRQVFSLYNRATRKTMVYKDQTFSDGYVHVQLLDVFNPCDVRLSTLWTMGDDLGGGYREIRALRNVSMVLDALQGAQNGTFVGVFRSQSPEVPNAQWTMTSVP